MCLLHTTVQREQLLPFLPSQLPRDSFPQLPANLSAPMRARDRAKQEVDEDDAAILAVVPPRYIRCAPKTSLALPNTPENATHSTLNALEHPHTAEINLGHPLTLRT